MKERPILFSAPMVRAILGGAKTMTRRVVKPQPDWVNENAGCGIATGGGIMPSPRNDWLHWRGSRLLRPDPRCRYGLPGDRRWVRETFAIVPRTAYARSDGVQQTLRPDDDHDAAIYRAGWDRSNGGFRWRPSIHMPRWASRILLEIADVRVERLQDISDGDAQAEGIEYSERFAGYCIGMAEHYHSHDPRLSYASLWESINGPDSWAANSWVWVVTFRRVEP